MLLDETISYRKKHKKIFVPYIEGCIREIFIRMDCRMKYMRCEENCSRKEDLSNNIAGHICTDISNVKMSCLSKTISKNIPMAIQQESNLSEMYLKDLICGIYKICVNAKISFSLLICTMVILRLYEKKNVRKKQLQPKLYKHGLLKKTEHHTTVLDANFLLKFFIALIITQKYYNDYSYTMSDYHNLLLHVGGKDLSFVQLADLNSYERIFLLYLNHDLRVDEILLEREKIRIFIDEDEYNRRSMVSWVFYTFRCR